MIGLPPSLEKPDLRTPWWLPGGHSQTLWRRTVTPRPEAMRRERVWLADGDFIDLDWAEPESRLQTPFSPVVFLLHGLCGSSSSPYIVSLQNRLRAQGVTSVAMNFRGCSGEINRLARAYHSGCTEDLDEVYRVVQAGMPGRRFLFAGFSLGGNVLLKWMTEAHRYTSVLGAVAVSTPFSLASCSEALQRGASRIYGHYFRRRLIRDVEAKRRLFASQHDNPLAAQELEKLKALGDLQRLKTLWEFDDQVTAPLHGFRDALDYYSQCSSGPVLAAIQRPTVLIQSANDPLIPPSSLPAPENLPAWVPLSLTSSGGHVGFTSADDPLWLETRMEEAFLWIERQSGRTD